jgi:hypothetical protein
MHNPFRGIATETQDDILLYDAQGGTREAAALAGCSALHGGFK